MAGKTNYSRKDEELRTAEIMDVSDALHRLGNDEELFRDIVQIYLEDVPEMVQTIRTAVAEADARTLQRAAHSLKGLAATLSASNTMNGAVRLEQMGASGNLTDAAAAVDQIERRVEQLNKAVEAYLHDGKPARS